MANRIDRRQFVAGATAATAGFAAGLHAPAILGASSATQWGDLVGRFVYDGTPPERKKLKVDVDVECCGKLDLRDESLMVGREGGLANVFVYVRERRVDICPELEKAIEPRVLIECGCVFVPHCMAIWFDKQEYRMVNAASIPDNVAFSPPGDTPANVILAVGDAESWKFRRAQTVPIPVLCNYHPWESAYVLPRDNPYTAISAMDGTFRIPKLPIGKRLEFQVWQERVGYVATPAWDKGRFAMEIKPGVNDLGTIKLPAQMFEK